MGATVAVVALAQVNTAPAPKPQLVAPKSIPTIPASALTAKPEPSAAKKTLPPSPSALISGDDAPTVTLTLKPPPTVSLAPLAAVKVPKMLPAARPSGGDPRIRLPNLSRSPETSHQPSIAAVGDDVYVVWTEGNGAGREIFMAISRDSGASFFGPYNLSGTPAPSFAPRVVANALGVHVAWVEQSSAGMQVFFTTSRDRGESFAPARMASPTFVTVPEVQMAVDGADAFATFVGIVDNTAVPRPENVMLVNLTTATAKEVVRGFKYRHPTVAVRGSKVLVVAENYVDDWDVFAMYSPDRGSKWQSDISFNARNQQQTTYSNSFDQWSSSVVFGEDGRAHMLYESNRNAQHWVAYHFGAPELLYRGGGDNLAVSALPLDRSYGSLTNAAYLKEMQPHGVAVGTTFFGTCVRSNIYANGNLRSDVVVWRDRGTQQVLGEGRTPKITANAEGNFFVAWAMGDPTTSSIVGLRSADFSSFRLTTQPTIVSAPEVAAARANFVVAWTDVSTGNQEIFVQVVPVR